jgi:hypothetical protein
MMYKLLGKRELRVSELFRNNDNWRRFGYIFERSIQGKIKKIFNLFVQVDGNYIDIANVYQN